ncbi:MAG: carboxypeptidase-like regulatory domain-containing protein [Microscillaceae bacterium]|jgi:hypothetical protein|nr:carboxypeptidase-like regulatory domain-containing protein [Microscillaceae bacterium]
MSAHLIKYFFVLLFLICANKGLIAQNSQTISGVLKDESSQPVVGAIIQIINAEKRILTYAISDSQGRYTIIQPTIDSTLTLIVQAFGFETATILLEKNSLPKKTYDITLKPKEYTLSTLTIKGSPYEIKEKGDTTRFKAAQFSDSTERNLEQLLQKIPGIKIDDKGKIFFKNREVEQVFLDGDDLFGQNYSLLTRNLQAQIIDNIDFIDNFNNIPQLNGIHQSGKLVLNLEIKEDLQNKLLGSLHLAYGNDQRRDIALHLMSILNKKHKFYGFVNHTNLGTEPFERAPSTESSENNSIRINQLDDSQVFLAFAPSQMSNFQLNTPNFLDKELIRFNSPTLASFSYIGKPKPSAKLVLTGIFLNDRLKQFFDNQANYYLQANSSLVTREAQTIQNTDALAGMRANFSKTVGTKSSWQYYGFIQKNNRSNARMSNFFAQSNFDLPEQDTITEQQNLRFTDIANQLNFTTRINPQTALLLRFKQKMRTSRESAHLSSLIARYDNFVAANDSINQMMPQMWLRAQDWGASGTIIHKNTQGTETSYTLGVKYKLEKARDSTFFNSNNNSPENPTEFQARNQFSNLSIYGQYTMQKKIGNFFWRNGLKASLDRVSSQTTNTSQNPNFWLIAPSTQLEYRQKNNQFSLQYDYQINNPLGLSLLRANFTPIDYRNFSKGVQQLSPINRHQVSLTYHNVSPFLTSLISFYTYYAHNRQTYSQRYSFSPLLAISETVLLGKSQEFYGSFNLEQYLYGLKSKLKIDSEIIYQQTPSEVQGIGSRENQIWNYNIGIKLATALDIPVNFLLGASSMIDRVIIIDTDEKQLFSNIFYKFQFNIFLRPIWQKRLSLKVENSLIINGQKLHLFSNILIRYDLPLSSQKKLPIQLSARNMTNHQNFSQIDITNLSRNNANYRLIPFYLMLGTSFNF